MSFARLLAPLALLSAFTACFEKEVGCDDYAAASVQITLVDEAGDPVSGASVVATTEDGDIVCEDWDGSGVYVYVCGYEVSGLFEITIEAEGYDPLELELEVSLTEDECHVETVQETVTLIAVAP